jgi:hypothetical protein
MHISQNEVWAKILEPALRYPSGDNAQPFTFRLTNDNHLDVYHCGARANHLLNPDNMSSLIALGGFLTNLEIAAAQANYTLEYDLKLGTDSLPMTTHAAWATARLQPAKNEMVSFAEQHATLFPSLALRKTDRAPYKPLSSSRIVTAEGDLPSELGGVEISYSNGLSEEFLRYFLEIEASVWKDENITRDIFSQVHLTKKSYLAKRWGLHHAELGLRLIELPLIALLKILPKFPRLAWNLGFKFNINRRQREILSQSRGFALFSLINTRPEDFVALGRAMQLWWLKITKIGLVAQPLTSCSLIVGLTHLLENRPLKQLKQSETATHQIFSRDFKISEKSKPMWLFRFGESIRNAPLSLRLDLKQLDHTD